VGDSTYFRTLAVSFLHIEMKYSLTISVDRIGIAVAKFVVAFLHRSSIFGQSVIAIRFKSLNGDQ
jgi:hypothetical protein